MKTWLAFLTSIFLIGTATATLAQRSDKPQVKPNYIVDGVALGSQAQFNSPIYREYMCSSSDQFDGFTRCQKTRNEREQRGAFNATYLFLHALDGSIVYINRYQEPAFFRRNGIDEDIQRMSRRIGGDTPRITRLSHRSGLPDGVLALWGKAVLEPLDSDSIKLLTNGKSPKKGLLIDFLGNFTRSAQEGLPIYRISGGAGFVWAASYDQRGRGTLRFAAVDASRLASPPAQQAPIVAQSSSQQVPLAEGRNKEADGKLAELKHIIEKLQADLAVSATKITELEKPKADMERALKEAEKARADAEIAKRGIEQEKIADKANFDAVIAQVEANKATSDAKSRAWEILSYGAIASLIFLIVLAALLIISRQRVREAKHQALEPEATLRTEDELRRELEKQVASIHKDLIEEKVTKPLQVTEHESVVEKQRSPEIANAQHSGTRAVRTGTKEPHWNFVVFIRAAAHSIYVLIFYGPLTPLLFPILVRALQ